MNSFPSVLGREVLTLLPAIANFEMIELKKMKPSIKVYGSDTSFANDAEVIHIAAVNYWKAKLPNRHWAKATDCEEDAAQAAVAFLGAGLVSTAAAVVVSGPLAPAALIGGVGGSIFGSVAMWAISIAGC